jgi:ABC-type bacteriocin/lantibiotic exporter with double-glycine peptidase domain
MAERGPGPVRRAGPVPTVLQMEAAECGAACLAMVLAAFGRWETLDAVRDSCGVSRDGVSAADIVEAAGRRGLEASA